MYFAGGELRNLALAQKVRWVCAKYTGLVTLAMYYCSHKVLQACPWQRLTQVPVDYMGLLTQPMYLCFSIDSLGFLLAESYMGLGLGLHDPCTLYQQQFFVS